MSEGWVDRRIRATLNDAVAASPVVAVTGPRTAADGRVAALEVKAGSQVTRAGLRGLEFLRDRLGERFVAGRCADIRSRSAAAR
ncbi:MAG: hypothetical protein JO100_07750 [Pseudonocardia sp.]|nr:hypothetical protein [Pseudonocardia sp.]